MKAQIALEYLIIISFALMVLVPYTLYLQNVSRDVSEENDLAIASSMVQKIGQMADWVHSQGSPARASILIQIPRNVEEISFEGKQMTWKVRTRAGISEIYYISSANLTGSLPTTPGYYEVLVQAIERGVNVSVSSS
ncbi:MAG: hypothetical protein QW451_02430 [Candidatus Aenigmatarchaeota archaeon]